MILIHSESHLRIYSKVISSLRECLINISDIEVNRNSQSTERDYYQNGFAIVKQTAETKLQKILGYTYSS